MGISPKLLNDGEEVVVDTRTHVKALLWPIVILVLLLAVGAWLTRVVSNDVFGLVVWILVALLAAWFVLRPFLEWLTATYTITNRRLITRSGILARRGHDIPLTRISDVAYELGVIDRMLGCGTLIISDASTHGRVLLHDIPRVEATQRTLNELLHYKESQATDDGT